jgi:uncharacterized protein with PIN domain
MVKISLRMERDFFLEASLSGLAKWLRFMGYRVSLAEKKITPEVISNNQDKFFLITSPETASLLERHHLSYLLLPRGSLKQQLFFLIHKLNLKSSLSLDICTLCGEKLISVKKEDFRERIPPKVWERYQDFNYCPKCDKLYWEGDHIKRLRKRFRALLKLSET